MHRSLPIAGALLSFFLIDACQSFQEAGHVPIEVEKNCTSCHLAPNPKGITADKWTNSVLPRMSLYFSWVERSRYGYANEPFYNKLNKLPMTDTVWSAIVDFYKNNGLDTVHINGIEDLPCQPFFNEKLVNVSDSLSGVTAISSSDDGSILLGIDRNLIVTDTSFLIKKRIKVESDITQLYHQDEWYMVLSGGINPHDRTTGSIHRLRNNFEKSEQIINELRRPVEMFKNDRDIFISEFGYNYGVLSKISLDAADSTKQKVHNLPGSYRIKMMNLYGTNDESIIVTLSQAQEGIYEIVKKGERYRIRPLLRFEPEYGLSDVAIFDVNLDGLDDLLVVNGDNADFSIIPKPYHGVRLYINKGGGDFTESFHYQAHGATQCRFIDVDGKYGIDFIISSYFAEDDGNSVLIFQSTSENGIDYQPYTFDQSTSGNWMIMDTGDIDLDGDEDVIIGKYSKGPKAKFIEGIKDIPDLLVLTNNLIKT